MFSYFSGRFDTSGYILPLLVPEITPGDGFCDGRGEEELGILVVGCIMYTERVSLFLINSKLSGKVPKTSVWSRHMVQLCMV